MNKYIIGLTGQSGAGKTTVSKYFRQKGFAVIDCDIVARNVTRQGSCCNKELAEIFPQCFDESLSLDRQALAKIVFSNKDKLNQLNNIILPLISKLKLKGWSKRERDILFLTHLLYLKQA